MNGGLRGTPTASPLKNVHQMEKVNPYRNGIPKDLPNRTKDNHWVSEVDEKQAEESLSLYCKPVELYNIIQQRCENQPLFLQRCLSYKIHAASQRRIKMTLTVTGYCMGKAKGKDPGPGNGVSVHTVFVMVTRPVTHPAEGQVVYRLRQAQVLRVGGSHFSSSEGTSQAGVTFILPELRKLVQNPKNGDVVLFIIGDSSNAEKGTQVATLANCSGCVIWGKLAVSSLCLNWLRNSKDSSWKAQDGNGVETTSQVDLRHGDMQLEDSRAGMNIKISTMAKTTMERSLVQLQVHISGGEVGQTTHKSKTANGTFPRSLQPYSLSHAWRPRVGRVVFHYLYYHGMLRKTEVTEDFSCPFCLNGCASFKGLRGHLNASHDLFNFEYLVSGELQVVNVTCRPDVVGPQGNIRDMDGLSDPRVKNFSYWFRRSRFRRRRLPVTTEEHLQDKEIPNISRMGATSQLAEEPDLRQTFDLHQIGNVKDEDLDATIEPAETVATPDQHIQGDSLLHRTSNKVPNGLNVPFPNGTIDGSRKTELKHVDKTSTQKSRAGKPQDTDNLGQVVKQRSVPAQKRQRMKGILGERSHARSRPSPTFGGACASAGGQDLDDCGMQPGLSIPNKSAADRPDMPRTYALLQKRQYFHSHTAQPMDTDQLFGDRDSEDEVDSVIADLEDRRMLDDFVDVTPEEKEVMHLWNSFVRRNRVVADGHCPWGCEEFSRENAQRFGENPALRRCLMLFLVKLWNHHLVDGPTISRCLTSVDSYELKKQDEQKKERLESMTVHLLIITVIALKLGVFVGVILRKVFRRHFRHSWKLV